MKKFLIVISLLASMNTAHARSVAVCESGFAIQTLGNNKAACVKTESVEDDIGARRCSPGSQRVSAEAADGGDLCQGQGIGSVVALPALDCKLAFGVDARNKLIRGNTDRCVKTVRRTVNGDISVRNE